MKFSDKTDKELISIALVIGSGVLLVTALVSVCVISGVHPILAGAVAICILIVIGCLLGCRQELQNCAQEIESPEAIGAHQEVQEQIAILSTLLLSASEKIQFWQRESAKNLNVLDSDGIRALTAAQRILDAMNNRRQILLSQLDQGTSEAIFSAAEAASEKLSFSNTSFDSVSGVCLPDLSVFELETSLDDLFARIESSRVERFA